MKLFGEQRLLSEILAEEQGAGFRQASLDAGLTYLRRRKRQQVAKQCGVAMVFIALASGMWLRSGSRLSSQPIASSASFDQTQAAAQVVPVKVISDQELFALFPNRPLALVGRAGEQELVFLDSALVEDSRAPQTY
jgi:hypothetical protein